MKKTITDPVLLNFARILCHQPVSDAEIAAMYSQFAQCPQAVDLLACPAIPVRERQAALRRLCPDAMVPFFQTVCAHGQFGAILDILSCAQAYRKEEQGIQPVTVWYADEKPDQHLIQQQLGHSTNRMHLEITYCRQAELLGGYRIKINDFLYDFSVLGYYEQLKNHLIRR